MLWSVKKQDAFQGRGERDYPLTMDIEHPE